MKIHKSLTPDEKLKISNIQALCQELLAAEVASSEETNPEETVQKQEAEKPQENVEKSVQKSETANENVETRMNELPTELDGALDKVTKSLNELSDMVVTKEMTKQKEVASPEMQVLGQTMLVLKSMQKRLDEQGQALNGILEGMGITEDILKVEKAAPRQAVQPSANDILNALASIVQKSAQAEPVKVGTMNDVITSLWHEELRRSAK